MSSLTSISPIDGRYKSKTFKLSKYFSEFGYIKYRLHIEVEYFISLCDILPQLSDFPKKSYVDVRNIVSGFSESDAEDIKIIENTTNHDVKAIEYYLKSRFDVLGLDKWKEFIHFGLTSQDINNTSIPLLFKESNEEVLFPRLELMVSDLEKMGNSWIDIPMLAHTHGQPASPTTVGKEFLVFVERIKGQIDLFNKIPYSAKFGGATGNFNAHYVSYPKIDWIEFADNLVNKKFGLKRSKYTTQIDHYDNISAQFDCIKRINTILIDLCKDIWTYISMGYFNQAIINGEIGSSAMPHKVNPIDFENAEGNLGIANSLFEHFSAKLPISRLQRDLTDSTVMRNIGVPVSHTLISILSIQKGLSKLMINEEKINLDLENNWIVISEAIQTILRREGYSNPYEKLKDLTRGNNKIDKNTMVDFIKSLDVSNEVKSELLSISPQNYTGFVGGREKNK